MAPGDLDLEDGPCSTLFGYVLCFEVLCFSRLTIVVVSGLCVGLWVNRVCASELFNFAPCVERVWDVRERPCRRDIKGAAYHIPQGEGTRRPSSCRFCYVAATLTVVADLSTQTTRLIDAASEISVHPHKAEESVPDWRLQHEETKTSPATNTVL